MAKTKLHENPVNTNAELPKVGSMAQDFVLTATDLSDHNLAEYKGKNILMNIYPSIDTSVCSLSVSTFNEKATAMENTIVLGISRDLPFALQRFCAAEGIDKVYTLSDLRSRDFGRKYGLEMVDGPMAGLLARAVILIDEKGVIRYTQLVDEITHEPDYDAAIAALKAL